jgi:hypothetical protein
MQPASIFPVCTNAPVYQPGRFYSFTLLRISNRSTVLSLALPGLTPSFGLVLYGLFLTSRGYPSLNVNRSGTLHEQFAGSPSSEFFFGIRV